MQEDKCFVRVVVGGRDKNDRSEMTVRRQRRIENFMAVSPAFESVGSHYTEKLVRYKDALYQLIPVEIEKEAEIGLVLGQVEGEQWLFIDEILPNGMIEMHGGLKEGDYLIQVGIYNLEGVGIKTALEKVENAYDEGRKTLSFVAARQQKTDTNKPKSLK